jgi:hypothetical protein
VAVAGLKGRVAVLKQNAYSMQQGGISVAHKAKPKENPLAKKRQVGGEGVGRERGRSGMGILAWDLSHTSGMIRAAETGRGPLWRV